MWATWLNIKILSHLPKQCICVLDMIKRIDIVFP